MNDSAFPPIPQDFHPDRLANLEALREAGVDPYPYSYDAPTSVAEVARRFEELEGQTVRMAGRLTGRREMGKTAFLNLTGDGERFQLYVRKDALGPELFKLVTKRLDLGDILGVGGKLFRTMKGEPSLEVAELTVLAKSLAPIPYGKETDDKSFYALADLETKRQERVLDWLTNRESRLLFEQRFRIIRRIRDYLDGEGFLEVETPTIEPVYGGAEARPFTTSIWALDEQRAYLRISPELYLKRFIVGGFDKVYTICKNFRNENIDATHNPEFTMIEWYEAYTDYERQMERFEALVCHLVQAQTGGMTLTFREREIDFTPPWPRLRVPEQVERLFGKPYDQLTREEVLERMRALGVEDEKIERDKNEPMGALVMEVVERALEDDLWGPCFLCDHPEDISPLTKAKRGRPGFVERFEPFAGGMEIGNAYSELTDPVAQYQRFVAQRQAQGGQRDYADHPMDWDFIKAVGCGMPPTGGVGLGVDRVIMLLLGIESIRDIIPFPMRKSK